MAKRNELETAAFEAVAEADARAQAMHAEDPAQAVEWLTAFSSEQAHAVFAAWQQFGDRLVAEYADGGLNFPGQLNEKIGYPREWLLQTRWPNGPTRYERPAPAEE